MWKLILDTLNSWNRSKSERQKLQHTYAVLSLLVVLIAGVVSLINVNLGRSILLIAVVSLATFCINSLVWNLLQSSLLDKLSSKPKK